MPSGFCQNTIEYEVVQPVVEDFQEEVGYVFDFYADSNEVNDQLDMVSHDVGGGIKAIRVEV